MKFIQGTVAWGIIGCGDVCEVKSGPAFSKVLNSKLVAVMRREELKAKDYALRHGVPKFYTNADDLIRDPDVNAVYVATPPAFHETYAIACIKAGKPVYIEKPVALNAMSCQRMIEVATFNQVPAVTAHYRRGLPLFRKVKEIVHENRLGAIRTIEIRLMQPPKTNARPNGVDDWRIDPNISGGGLFFDLAPHQLDILFWIFGPPIEVTGRSINQAQLYDAPDLTTVQCLFAPEIYFQGIWCFNVDESATEDTCVITGEKGMVVFSFFKNAPLKIMQGSTSNEMVFDSPLHIQQPMIHDTVRYFRGEADNPCALQEALVTMQIMDRSR